MGGVVDFLFGSSDDAKQVGVADTMLPTQRKLLNDLAQKMNFELNKSKAVNRLDSVQMPTTGKRTVWALNDLLESGRPQTNQTALDAIDQIMAGSDMGEFDPTSTMEWWESAVKEPALDVWKDEIIPQVMEPFIGANAFDSGANRRAVAKSGEDLMTNITGILADRLQTEKSAFDTRAFEGGQADLNRILNIPGIASGLEGQNFNEWMQTLGMGTNVGEWERQVELAQQPYNNPWLRLLSPAMQTQAFSPIVQGPSQTQGALQSIGVPLLSSMFLGGFF